MVKKKQQTTPANTDKEQAKSDPILSFDLALAESAFQQLKDTLSSIPAASLKPIRVDLEQAALVALSFALYGKCTKGCAAGDGGGVEWALTERITMANESETGVSKNGAKGAKRADPVGFLNPRMAA